MKFIPEGDLYRLIVHSKLPAAERFEQWVFDEVLPSIRQRGVYGTELSAIISQTVHAVIQEIMPLLSSEPVKAPGKRIRYKQDPGIIRRLEAPVREEIDDMILSRQYTYADISEYGFKHYGIRVSRSAVGRYALRLFKQIGD